MYKRLNNTNPSNLVYKKVVEFANRYKTVLTSKEHEFLTKKKYSIANFYCLPKLHKSAYVNQLLQKGGKYIHIQDFSEAIEGRPIVGGPSAHTCGISEMIDIITAGFHARTSYLLKNRGFSRKKTLISVLT